ncbi:hypothetical protein [Vibrio japonicus]|uniref:Uncharacterized protein n=1 Tax=Vibrio japonicus TaxID=1824638 RepID=A0ABY5LCI6_9VIBR|nr:hypothetical protein [Vibrio japonicus]UUM29714.1 hypothetical protein NP165_08290 [Vibrio japonicus]
MHGFNANELVRNSERDEEDLRNWLLDQPEGIVSAEELCLTN